MLQENTPISHLVEFTSGAPIGAFLYTLTDEDGLVVNGLEDEVISLAPGAVSATISIPALANLVSKPVFERRTITWTYPITSGTVVGSFSYSLQKTVPFPVTSDGVRVLLGVTDKEIPDAHVDLLGAYVAFQTLFEDDTVLEDFETAGDYTSLQITRAIEALAALKLLPTLQLSLARRLNSGTNEYERWNRIDWEGLRGSIEQIITDTVILIDPTLEFGVLPIFTLAIRVDPYTGV